MTNFAYKALDARGAQAAGEIEGESKAAVAAALRNKGLTVLDLNEVKAGWGQIQIGGRIKPKDLTVFSRQFATMVNSGLSMLRCLYVLEEQTPNKKFAAVISAVRADVEAGISLSDALEKHPKVFSRLYVSMVRAGELGGILDDCPRSRLPCDRRNPRWHPSSLRLKTSTRSLLAKHSISESQWASSVFVRRTQPSNHSIAFFFLSEEGLPVFDLVVAALISDDGC